MNDRLPAKPFQKWIVKRIAFYGRQWEFGGEPYTKSDGIRRTAFDLGLSEKALRRYRDGVIETARNDKPVRLPVDTFDRVAVEEALWHAGVFLWEVYTPRQLKEPDPDPPDLRYPKPCAACGKDIPTHDSEGEKVRLSKYREKKFCDRECYVARHDARVVA